MRIIGKPSPGFAVGPGAGGAGRLSRATEPGEQSGHGLAARADGVEDLGEEQAEGDQRRVDGFAGRPEALGRVVGQQVGERESGLLGEGGTQLVQLAADPSVGTV